MIKHGPWRNIQFGNVLELIRNGYSGKQVNFITEFPVSRIETISDGKIDLKKVGFVEKIPESYLLEEGDILFSNINSLKHIGKIAYVKEGLKLYHGMNLLVFRFSPGINSKFLYYKLLQSKQWFEKMAAQAVNQASINQVEIKKCTLEIPTLVEEQSKITEVLETVDSAIEKTEELIAKQERIKTGLMQDLLTKGIDEHGNIRSEETHEFKESPIGRIPAEWDTILIKDVTQVKQGLQIAIEKRFKEEGINRYRYITVQYLNNPKKYTEYIEAPSEGLICNSDDILFTRTGNTGQIVTGVKGVFHNNFFKVDYIKDKLVKDFLIMFLEWRRTQDKIRDLAGTTTIPDLNHGDFYGLDFNLPSMKEQNRIVDAFSSLEVKITLEKFELNKLHRIKTALMQDLLSGRVRVKSLLDDLEVTS